MPPQLDSFENHLPAFVDGAVGCPGYVVSLDLRTPRYCTMVERIKV
jgi:hypothetical protein